MDGRSGALSIKVILNSRSAVTGLVVIGLLILFALVGPELTSHDPLRQDLLNRNQTFSAAHWLGTDATGRDLFSRLAHGARLSLVLSITAVGLGTLLGVPIGVYSGYRGGLVDQVIVGVVDILLALPSYLLAILIMAVVGRPTIWNIAIAVGISIMPGLIRVARADTLSLRDQEMIEAARALGVPGYRLFLRHILPNILSSIVVVATMRLGSAILVESSLSFLGLGLSLPTPAWGLMINEGLGYLARNPWMSLLPGMAIMLMVLGFNLFGDGLRDALDPRLRGR